MSKDHFVPQMILKRFKKPGGTLWYYDSERPLKGVEERNPASVFFHRRFSTSSDKEFSVEEQFRDKIETPLNILLDKILPRIRLGMPIDISIENAALLTYFMYYQAKRRPEVVRDVMQEATYGPLEFQDQDEENAVKYTGSILDSEEDEDRSFVHDLRLGILTHTNPAVIESLIEAGIWFARAPDHETFCITSNPIKSHSLHIVDDNGAARHGESLVVAVSYDIAVCFGPPWLDRTIQRVSRAEDVRQINASLWAQSNKIAGASKEQIERIVGSRP